LHYCIMSVWVRRVYRVPCFLPVVQTETGSPNTPSTTKEYYSSPLWVPGRHTRLRGRGTQFRRRDRHSGALCTVYYTYSLCGLGSRKNNRNETVAAIIPSIPLKVQKLSPSSLLYPPKGANTFQIYTFYLTGEGGG
jgi:hypothetical protein